MYTVNKQLTLGFEESDLGSKSAIKVIKNRKLPNKF